MCAHVCFAALTFHVTDALAQASIFESGPYVANLTAHSVVVRIETEAAEQLTLTVEPGGKRVADDAAKNNIHSLAIDGLEPKKTYRYTVQSTRG
ncbi:MAG TPA: hypothetical protein VGH87_14535, partial [Polyangiaceae bacterium]